MDTDLHNKNFTNVDQETVKYDGSPLSWRVSAYALIQKDNKVLIIKNKKEKLHDIVGGGIEFGENIAQALSREVYEECGAKIKIGKLLHAQVDWFYHKSGKYYQTMQLFYTATLTDRLEKPSEENTEWRGWVDLDEIGKKYKLPRNVEYVVKEKLIKDE